MTGLRPKHKAIGAGLLCGLLCLAAIADTETQLLWGDTHLHSSYSFDAFLFQNRSADPDTAFRYARGLPVVHPFHRARVQIETPLDFLVISDHAELTAVPKRLFEGDEQMLATDFGRQAIQLLKQGKEAELFHSLVAGANTGDASVLASLNSETIRQKPWREIAAAADNHNQPGVFTALIGWEWSSIPNAANLHRVVFMDGDATAAASFLPFSMLDSIHPEDLWAWLATTADDVGANFVAIPHNMNLSKGRMFPLLDSFDKALSADYARLRNKWEPVAEVTQIKGDSETHPLLSPEDEFADFERYRFLIDARPDTDKTATVTAGDYARSALLRGLELGNTLGTNPYQFGMIGSTDSHTSLASAEENNFQGKMALDSIPERGPKTRSGNSGPTGWDYSASGLAAVWAENNSREAIVAAFQRKEVYASTGPRIQVRLFAGWEFTAGDLDEANLAAVGYRKGVPMGGELLKASHNSAPSFLIDAARDPKGANLDRIQIVKGWLDSDGQAREKIFNVAASDDRKPDRHGKLPAVGNSVDLASAEYSNSIGSAHLQTVWTDPEFNPEQAAFYYARVLQIPTPRHSLYDSIALQQAHPEGIPSTIQERAYTSPVWYKP